ncbi:hypothetical protein [Algoriphagus sp. A40]|uniref:hypothetical protein n=1 Tax=Algoriphagus sp. A40 TaxID=1945863 RepID=UPI0011155F85|nr:hypothetical protein [Algoriphagus sp. A40]
MIFCLLPNWIKNWGNFAQKVKDDTSQKHPLPLSDSHRDTGGFGIGSSICPACSYSSQDLGNLGLYGNSVIFDQLTQLLFA